MAINEASSTKLRKILREIVFYVNCCNYIFGGGSFCVPFNSKNRHGFYISRDMWHFVDQ